MSRSSSSGSNMPYHAFISLLVHIYLLLKIVLLLQPQYYPRQHLAKPGFLPSASSNFTDTRCSFSVSKSAHSSAFALLLQSSSSCCTPVQKGLPQGSVSWIVGSVFCNAISSRLAGCQDKVCQGDTFFTQKLLILLYGSYLDPKLKSKSRILF